MLNDLSIKLKNYLTIFPEEKESLKQLIKQTKDEGLIFDRKNFTGHVTATGLIISSDNQILLIFNKKLKMYLAPGGHIENDDKNILEATIREVSEETNLKNIKLYNWCKENNCPLIIDTHFIPENKNKNEASHYHHDFMFIFHVEDKKVSIDKNEISDFKWIDIENAPKNKSNIHRAIEKIRKLNI